LALQGEEGVATLFLQTTMAVATLFTDELQRRAKPKMMGGDGTHELYAAHFCAVEHRTAGNTEDASCAICMEAMNVESGDVWVLPCRHAFHRTCIGTVNSTDSC
jgi:hypothetical protein